MFDIDIKASPSPEKIDASDLDNLVSTLSRLPYRFRIYKTYNGYHVFVISEEIKYNSELILKISKLINSDIFYTYFTYKTGFKVRLSKKKGRDEKVICEYLGDINDNIEADEKCLQLIKIHDYFVFNAKK